MKTVNLAERNRSIEEILQMATADNGVLLEARDGKKYFLSRADDFAMEVDLLRKHHDFLTVLDECKRDDSSIPFEEIERRFR